MHLPLSPFTSSPAGKSLGRQEKTPPLCWTLSGHSPQGGTAVVYVKQEQRRRHSFKQLAVRWCGCRRMKQAESRCHALFPVGRFRVFKRFKMMFIITIVRINFQNYSKEDSNELIIISLTVSHFWNKKERRILLNITNTTGSKRKFITFIYYFTSDEWTYTNRKNINRYEAETCRVMDEINIYIGGLFWRGCVTGNYSAVNSGCLDTYLTPV